MYGDELASYLAFIIINYQTTLIFYVSEEWQSQHFTFIRKCYSILLILDEDAYFLIFWGSLLLNAFSQRM